MGSLDSGILTGVGMLSALLFLVAGAMVLADGEAVSSGAACTALYVTAAAGVLAAVSGTVPLLKRDCLFGIVRSVTMVLSGILFAVSAAVPGSALTILAAAGLFAAVSVVMDALLKWNTKMVGAMYISAVFAVVLLILSAMVLVSGSGTYAGAVPVVFGLWIGCNIVVSRAMSDATSEVKAPKANGKHDGHEDLRVEEPKPQDAKAPVSEPVQVKESEVQAVHVATVEEPVKEHVAQAVTEESKPEPKPTVSSPQDPADIMRRLVRSEDVHKVVRNEVSEGSPVREQDVLTGDVSEGPFEATVSTEPVVREPEPEAVEESADPKDADESVVQSEVEESVEKPVEEPSAVNGNEPVSAEEPDTSNVHVSEEEAVAGHEDDLFTDYSPEAVVRRAAWNKGLRCRRDYGEHAIPVAFVKGKVAVFVQSADADTSLDEKLVDEGWTVLRYDEALITDGKVQGEEIAAAVKANLRSAKASAKKKKKTAKK